jgi:hypothetical protein
MNSADQYLKAAVLVGKKLIGNDNCVSRSTTKTADIPEKTPLIPAETSKLDAAKEKKNTRDQYAVEQEQREREEGWRDNPSCDVDTQTAIILEYRALHEQFKKEGLYQCNYSAYAWESLRYLVLFAAFGYFLHIKWYITSATFLGLFWVCLPQCPDKQYANSSPATNHVHSPRRRPPWYHWKLCLRHPHRRLHCRFLLRSQHRLVEVFAQRAPSRHQHARTRP